MGDSTAGPSSDATVDAPPGDLEGLVVLRGGTLSIGTNDGAIARLDGPAGQSTGLSATKGRLIVRTAGPALAMADVDQAGGSLPEWHVVKLPMIDQRHQLSMPILSPRGDKVAVATAAVGRALTFDVVVSDLSGGASSSVSIDREANGPPVWIDDSNLLLEGLPIQGGGRFLRLNVVTGRIDPVANDGFGPAISGDGSLLAVASTDGSVVAVPAAGWLTGHQPHEGSLADASGSVFELAVDSMGRRIAIGYADEAGDPASIAVVIREGGAWRRRVVAVRIAAGAPAMLGWIN